MSCWRGSQQRPREDEQILYLQALGNSGDARALPAIQRVLSAGGEELRSAAVTALRFIAAEAVDGLIAATLLGDPSVRVRRSAVFAASFRPPLLMLPVLQQSGAARFRARVRGEIVPVLGRSLSLPGVVSTLQAPGQNDANAEVRQAAAALLTRAGPLRYTRCMSQTPGKSEPVSHSEIIDIVLTSSEEYDGGKYLRWRRMHLHNRRADGSLSPLTSAPRRPTPPWHRCRRVGAVAAMPRARPEVLLRRGLRPTLRFGRPSERLPQPDAAPYLQLTEVVAGILEGITAKLAFACGPRWKLGKKRGCASRRRPLSCSGGCFCRRVSRRSAAIWLAPRSATRRLPSPKATARRWRRAVGSASCRFRMRLRCAIAGRLKTRRLRCCCVAWRRGLPIHWGWRKTP